jgi:prophage regulatory protein
MSDLATRLDESLEMWRLPKVIERTGLKRASIYVMMREGRFPEARQIGAKAVAWRSSDVLAWMHNLPVASTPVGEE